MTHCFPGRAWAGIFLIGLCLASMTPAATLYVSTNNSPSSTPPYDTWAKAATNIQWAVDVATNGDTVLVTNGDYCVTNQIMVTTNITVRSVNGWTHTLVYADWPNYWTRCFWVTNRGTIDGFTISNGHIGAGADGGGGAFVSGTSQIQNCYILNNLASNSPGGGVSLIASSLMTNCDVFANLQTNHRGGGVHMRNSTMSFCRVVANTNDGVGTGYGGGVYTPGYSYILNCDIISNIVGGGNGSGGGIHAYYGSFISNCLVAFNTNVGSGGGGGICCVGGSMVVVDCVVSNNTGTYQGGGGILMGPGDQVINSVIVNNKALVSNHKGGGIACNGGLISNCVIAGNTAGGPGGGIYAPAAYSTYIIDSCRISNNITLYNNGGGVWMVNNRGELRNCLICSNTNMSGAGGANDRGGGGVYLSANYQTNIPFLYNCTIVNNYSAHPANMGGGVYVAGVTAMSNNIVNCIIVSNNTYSNTYPNINSAGSNADLFWYCCAVETSAPLPAGQGNITNDPAFSNFPAGNFRLGNGSPCINSGTNQSWMIGAKDLDGRPRIDHFQSQWTVDMGAYELFPSGTIVSFH